MAKKTYNSIFFKDEKLPFVESRYVVDSPYHYEKHFHTTLSVGAIEEGKVAYVHNNDEYLLTKNQLSIINPNIIHYCNPIQNESRSYHMVYIDVNWCKSLQETLFGNTGEFIPLEKVQLTNKQLYNEYINLNKKLLNTNIFYLEKEQELENFFTKLFLNHCNKDRKESNLKNSKAVEKAKEFIHENCLENITLEQIASASEVSKFHLTKLFKSQLSISPYKYLMNCKINLAKEYFSKGYKTIEVANITGFFDQSHFSSAFKKYVAATPNEYKNNIVDK